MTESVQIETRRVWAIAWPALLTNMLNVSVGIIDLKMVGSLGVAPIAAVGMAGQVVMLIMVLMIAISGGSSVLVAHAHGAGDRERVGTLAARSLVFMVAAALLVVTPLGLLFSGSLMQMLGAADHVVTLGAGYLRILFLGSIVTMLNFGISALLLGVGRTDISLWVLMVVNLLNVGLNYVFIFGAGPVPALGVTGAAVGTVAARTLGAAAGLWIVCDRRFPIQARFRDGLVFDWTLFRRVMYLGGPRSLQGIVRNTSRLITIRIITLLPDSTRALSAYTVAMQVQMMSVFIGLGFMSAAMARVGQNLGAGDPDSAERSGWISAVLAALLMGVVALVLLLLPTAIMGFFTGDREVIALGRTFFLIIAAIQPVMAVAFALGGALSGAGDPMSPFIYASVSDLLVVLVAGYLLAIPLGLGFTGVALGLALSGLTRTLPTVWKFRQGRWKVNRF